MRRNRVDRLCQYCGGHFTTTPSRVRDGRGKFCSRECHSHSQIGRHKKLLYVERVCQQCGIHFSLLARLLKSQTGEYCSQLCANKAKANPADPEVRKRKAKLVSITSRNRWKDSEYKTKLSKIRERLWQDPDFAQMMREAQSKSALEVWQRPEYRQRQIEAQKRRWEDPEAIARHLAGLNKKPNKPEQRLINIFSKCLPRFQYNGDFSLGVVLGGLIPDFVNVNGRKEVIELLGDYWHSPGVLGDRWQGSELGKVMIYNSLGYKCLIIWEGELANLTDDEIVERITKFFSKHRRKYASF